jgi:hypothetical protein
VAIVPYLASRRPIVEPGAGDEPTPFASCRIADGFETASRTALSGLRLIRA